MKRINQRNENEMNFIERNSKRWKFFIIDNEFKCFISHWLSFEIYDIEKFDFLMIFLWWRREYSEVRSISLKKLIILRNEGWKSINDDVICLKLV